MATGGTLNFIIFSLDARAAVKCCCRQHVGGAIREIIQRPHCCRSVVQLLTTGDSVTLTKLDWSGRMYGGVGGITCASYGGTRRGCLFLVSSSVSDAGPALGG